MGKNKFLSLIVSFCFTLSFWLMPEPATARYGHGGHNHHKGHGHHRKKSHETYRSIKRNGHGRTEKSHRTSRSGRKHYGNTAKAGRSLNSAARSGNARYGAASSNYGLAQSAQYISKLLGKTNQQIAKIEQGISQGDECTGPCAKELSKLKDDQTKLTTSLDNQRKIQERMAETVSDLSADPDANSMAGNGEDDPNGNIEQIINDNLALAAMTNAAAELALSNGGDGGPMDPNGQATMDENSLLGAGDSSDLGNQGKSFLELELEKLASGSNDNSNSSASFLGEKNANVLKSDLDKMLDDETSVIREVESAGDEGELVKNFDPTKFLPKNDPRRSFASFFEARQEEVFDPTVTGKSGPTLFEKLTRRYQAIEPLMQKN